MSFLFLGDVTSLQLWCLINELSFIQEVVRFYNWRWSRKGIHVLSHEVLADCVNATLTPPSILHSFQLPHRTHSLTHLSWEEYLGWLLSLHLLNLTFFTLFSLSFLTSKIGIMSISVTTFECDSQTSHALTCLILIKPLWCWYYY